jgi:hypothetical protein
MSRSRIRSATSAMRGANRPGIPGDEQMEQQQQQ